MKLKIIFFGTPEFAVPCLQALIDSPHQIVAVFTQPDRPSGRGQKTSFSPVKKVAQAHQLTVYQPETLRDSIVQEQLINLQADVMVVVAYGLILPKAVLNMTRLGALNVHPSLLPRWRGAAPIQATLLAGDEMTGVSIIQLTPKMDAGPILHQSLYKINQENSGQLHDSLAERGRQDLLVTLDLLSTNRANPHIQNEAEATYTRKINKADAQIDWHKSALQLEREVRAYNPWPVAYTSFQEKSIRIWEAQAVQDDHSLQPGSLFYYDNRRLVVAAAKGGLSLLTVQLAGARMVSVAEFIQGYRQHFDYGKKLFG
jgi:methionyl-tRNA formyltransferase